LTDVPKLLAHPLAGQRQAGFDRLGADVQDIGNLGQRKLLACMEVQHLALARRQGIERPERSLNILLVGDRLNGRSLCARAVVDGAVGPLGAALSATEAIPPKVDGNLEKPHPGRLPILKAIAMPPCPKERLLCKVLCPMGVTGQSQGEAIDPRNVLFEQSSHGTSSLALGKPPGRARIFYR
jgi:hypothetical protein